MWGGLGFFSSLFFCLACAASIYFYSEVKTDRPAWREELVLSSVPPPHSLEAQAALLTPWHCSVLAASLLGLCPQTGSRFLSFP